MACVTPRPEKVYSTCNYRGVYEHKVSHCNILEMKNEMINLVNPGLCMRIRVQLSFSKKNMKIIIKVEMGHNTNKTRVDLQY